MFTVCPKCALTLAVAAADLRAGQGYVRCGRCANVFNALLGLSDESAPGATATPARAVAQGQATPQDRRAQPRLPDFAREDASAPDAPVTDLPLAGASAPQFSPPPAAPRAASNERVELEVEEFRGTGTFETIVLEGDSFLHSEEQVAEEEVDIELADVSRRIEAARDSGDLARIRATAAEEAPEDEIELVDEGEEEEIEDGEQEDGEEQDDGAEDEVEGWRPPARARPGWLGITTLALLMLLLAAQAINHWRNDLATYGAWYGPLSRISAALGESLRPNWDLGAYDVRQLGAISDAADPRALRVRLSIANRGERSQALPLLRLNLLDRYGTVVSSGELKAEQYLPAALRGQQFIASQQRIDTEVSVVDATQQVSSFELDVCVPASSGGLRCAGDTPLLSARK
jgi:predicted Zn finger-like uncharacterized protein